MDFNCAIPSKILLRGLIEINRLPTNQAVDAQKRNSKSGNLPYFHNRHPQTVSNRSQRSGSGDGSRPDSRVLARSSRTLFRLVNQT